MRNTNRRHFLSVAAGASTALATSQWLSSPASAAAPSPAAEPFKISLAQWSLHKPLFAKEIDNLDFAKVAKERFGIEAVEYVNQFFKKPRMRSTLKK